MLAWRPAAPPSFDHLTCSRHHCYSAFSGSFGTHPDSKVIQTVLLTLLAIVVIINARFEESLWQLHLLPELSAQFSSCKTIR